MIRGTTGLSAIVFSQRMAPAHAWTLIEPVRIALQRLLDGVGSHDDMAAVGAAINLAWIRCKTIGDSKDAMAVLERGSRALLAVERRSAAGGGFAIDLTTEREPACDAINLYDTILRASSLRQWAQTEQEFLRTLRGYEAASA